MKRLQEWDPDLSKIKPGDERVVDALSLLEAKQILGTVLHVRPQKLDADDKEKAKEAFNTSGQLYVVYQSKAGECQTRHIEEKFMDILEHADHKKQAFVAGKMRPCGTCFGRMKLMNLNKGFNVVHGENPGYIWEGRFKEQPAELQTFTMQEYLSRGTYESETGGSGYATDSDSEGEDELIDG